MSGAPKPLPGAAAGAPDATRVAEEIRRILAADVGVSARLLVDAPGETHLFGRGVGLDSMEALVLVSSLERAFAFEAPDDGLTADAFATVETLAARVAGWIARDPAAGGRQPAP